MGDMTKTIEWPAKQSFAESPYRFGKSTHNSMISNSVTHLRSYTNTAIAEDSARAPMSPHRMPISLHRMAQIGKSTHFRETNIFAKTAEFFICVENH